MRRLLLVFSLAILLACSGSDDDGNGPGSCEEPTSQALSQPCCLAHGVDACGAGLFCAAFDGRTQPTCYAERSRPDNAACDADLHCTSNSCNPAEHKCRAMPWGACTAAVGCAPDGSGARHACVDDGEGGQCLRVGDGAWGQVCEHDGDCTDGICDAGRCSPDLACDLPGDRLGPCVDSPEGMECQSCITGVLYDCIGVCAADGTALGGCLNNSHCTDAACILEACEAEFCNFFACAEEKCDAAITCF